MAHDVRAIANLVLDVAEQDGVEVGNLAINKIVYFLHGWTLAKFGRPLVSAKIEAWKRGPVFRELYREFKQFKEKPIAFRATKINLVSGEIEECEYDISEDERDFLVKLVRSYLKITPYNLMMMSHEPDGPWDQVWNHASNSNPGMHISNELIGAYFEKQARH